MLKINEISRFFVGRRPLGLLLTDTDITVYEAGDGTVTDYDLYTGQSLRRLNFRDEVNVKMQICTLGSLLVAGQNKQLFAWTYEEEGLVYLVNQDQSLRKVRLGPYTLNSLVYSPSTQKLLITNFGDPRMYLVRADLSLNTLQSNNTQPGMTILARDRKTAYVADRDGESVLVIDMNTETILDIIAVGSALTEEYPLGNLPPDSSFLSILQVDDEIGDGSAPMTLSSDGRFLYICPTRADEAELRTPLVIIRLADQGLTVINDEGIRFPFKVEPNPVTSELYVSGIDETVAVNLTTGRVDYILGPGRLTGFKVAPNGEWAAGVDVFNKEIFFFDLQNKGVQTIPFTGSMPDNVEFANVSVLIDGDSQVAVVADIPANQVVVLKVETA